MQSVGEVMAIGRTFQESFLKALRGLETGVAGLDEVERKEPLTADQLRRELSNAGAQRIWVTMDHCSKDGSPKIVDRCALPLTAVGVVKRVYTDLAVIEVTPRGFEVLDMVEGLSPETLQARTGAKLHFAKQ